MIKFVKSNLGISRYINFQNILHSGQESLINIQTKKLVKTYFQKIINIPKKFREILILRVFCILTNLVAHCLKSILHLLQHTLNVIGQFLNIFWLLRFLRRICQLLVKFFIFFGSDGWDFLTRFFRHLCFTESSLNRQVF